MNEINQPHQIHPHIIKRLRRADGHPHLRDFGEVGHNHVMVIDDLHLQWPTRHG